MLKINRFIGFVGTVFILCSPVLATGDGQASIGNITGFGSLTPVTWLELSSQNAGGWSKSKYTGTGSETIGGNSFAEVKNNTGADITYNSGPYYDFSVSGSSSGMTYSASSSGNVTLSGTTASGMCSGPFGSYSNSQIAVHLWSGTHTVVSGDHVFMSGTWSITVNGG